MDKRRIETRTSCTAEMTCLSRAASYLESEPHYHSQDHLSVRLLPGFFNAIFHIPPVRRFFVHRLAPNGIYEYVIARTKYMDSTPALYAFSQEAQRRESSSWTRPPHSKRKSDSTAGAASASHPTWSSSPSISIRRRCPKSWTRLGSSKVVKASSSWKEC